MNHPSVFHADQTLLILNPREVQPLSKVPEKTGKRMWFSRYGGLTGRTDAHRTLCTDLLAALALVNDFIYLAATQVLRNGLPRTLQFLLLVLWPWS